MAADSIPGELAAACDEVRLATTADKIGGVQPDLVAAPETTEQASDLLRAAAGLKLAVVPRGRGTKLHWGCPPARADLVIDMTRMNRIVEHAAGDLVASVQAGTDLDYLAAALGSAGQRLAIDAGEGTVGGLVGTGAAGPLRLRYGTPRDLLIGLTVVRADGVVTRSGGKVVKNVAGYDLGKLFTGSRGTLGLITQATFRLHPVPAATGYVTTECTQDDCARLIAIALQAEFSPAAVEIDQAGPSAGLRLALAIEGGQAGVAERTAKLAGLLAGTVTEQPPAWWGTAARRDGTVLGVSFWPGRLTQVLAAIRTAAAAAGLEPTVGGSAAAGILHVAVPASSAADQAAALVTGLRASIGASQPATGSVVVQHAPAEVISLVDPFGPVPSLSLMRAVKQQFDPDALMSPGRFAGGL